MNKKQLIANNNDMNNEEYDKLIKKHIKEENVLKNMIISFFSGGLIGLLGEVLTNIFLKYNNLNDSYLMTFVVLIIIGSLLTGIGFFDKILSVCKCGLIVPSTGFANTMTSSAMDARSEGFIKGIGASIFKLTGSIILYGIFFGIIFGFIRSMIL
jgi:stage V sporulation protein AC